MQFKTALIALVALAAPALAFKVPEGAVDGVYTVKLGPNGEEIHEKISELTAPTTTAFRSRVVKRFGLDEVGCFQYGELNHGNTDAANAGLRQQLEGGARTVGYHASIYSIAGDTVAYCCNNRDEDNTCIESYHSDAEGLITNRCGWYKSGYAYDTGAHITYGITLTLDNFCPSS